MPNFFSSHPFPQHTKKEDLDLNSSEDPTIRIAKNVFSDQEIPHKMTQEWGEEKNSSQKTLSSPSEGTIYLKRLYAHYTTKNLPSGSPSLMEDLDLEAACAEATASYAAWKKMQEQLAHMIRYTHNN